MSDKELHTVVSGDERLLNSRPITSVSSDPDNLSLLTPNHFLIGEIGERFAPEAVDGKVFNHKKRWHRVHCTTANRTVPKTLAKGIQSKPQGEKEMVSPQTQLERK